MPKDVPEGRRLKQLAFDLQSLAQLFTQAADPTTVLSFFVPKSVDGARIVKCAYDIVRDQVVMVFEHDDWEVITPPAGIPSLSTEIRFTTARCGDVPFPKVATAGPPAVG